MLADRIIFVCIVVLAGVYFYATAQIPALEIGDPLGPKAFPRLLGVGLLIAAVMLVMEMRRGSPGRAALADDDDGDKRYYFVIAGVIGWTFAFFLVFEPLGYLLATMVYLLGLMSYFYPGKWKPSVFTAVLFAAGSYFMFTRLLGVNLPRGVLPF